MCNKPSNGARETPPGLRAVPMQAGHIHAAAAISAHAPDPWREQDFAAELARPDTLCYTACLGGQMVGYMCFRQAETAVELATIAIAPTLQGHGFGKQLLAQGLALAGAQGASHCLLEVRASNKAAIAVYRHLGFTSIARRPHLYAHPPEDGLMMQKPL